MSVMKERMVTVWTPGQGVSIRETEAGLFLNFSIFPLH